MAAVALGSGFAGLGYEIVWTRILSQSLGSDMMAVLGVVAGFFAGLCLGAFLLDRWIRGTANPRRAYAILELVIAGWAVACVWLLPWAGGALPPLLGPQPGAFALWAAGFALPAVGLLPATVAMGGTLAALERLMAASAGSDRQSALVYGANTAGAVAGTVAATFVLLPAFGLSGTLLALAALNGLCAAGAIWFGPRAHATPPAAAVATAVAAGTGLPLRLGAMVFLTGLLGIGFEMLLIRVAAQMLQDTIYTFAALLTGYLLGTALGGFAWQRLGRRARAAGPAWLVAATALVCLATAFALPALVRLGERWADIGVAGEFAVAAAMFLAPTALMGALFANLAQAARDRRGSLGWAVGVNSLGAGLAPLLTSQALIPELGVWNGVLLVSAGYLLLLPPRRRALAWGVAPAAAGVALALAPAPSFVRVPPGGALLAVREGPMATASVVDDASGARYLEVNGHFRMGGTNSVRSDFRQAWLPLLLHPAPTRAVFLGVGTGATLAGAARLPGLEVHGVELSSEVSDVLPWFANPTAPLPPVAIADARRYIAADRASYDVIVADLFHPALDGSGSLYTTEHFATVRRRLAEGGLFCQWLPLYQLDLPSLRTIARGFLDVFPNGSAWLAHFSVRTPMLALIGRRGPATLDAAEVARRLADPAVAPLAHSLGFDSPLDLLGQYLGGPRALAAFAGDGPRNTDDFPFVALDARRNVRALSAPPYTLLLTVIGGMRPDAAELLRPEDRDALAARLDGYWQARNAFIAAGAALPAELRGTKLMQAAAPGLLEAIRHSPEFNPAYLPLLDMAKSLAASDPAAAARLLHDIDAAAPTRGEARTLLERRSPN